MVSRRPPGSSAGLQEEFLEPPPPPQPRGRRGRGDPGGRPLPPPRGKTFYKNTIRSLPNVDCPGRSGPGRAENTALKRPRKRKRGGKPCCRRLCFGGAEETRVAAWLSDTSPASSSVTRQSEPSAASASVPEEEGNQPTCSAPRLLFIKWNLHHQQDFKRLSKYLDYFLRIDCQKWSDWVTGM